MDNININKIQKFLSNEPSVLLSYLFGSRVKGNSDQKSDWDIGIYFTEESLKTHPWQNFIIEAKLSEILQAEVQTIILNNTLNPLLGFEIIGRGNLLISKNENLRLDYENKTLRNYYDWSHTYKTFDKSLSFSVA